MDHKAIKYIYIYMDGCDLGILQLSSAYILARGYKYTLSVLFSVPPAVTSVCHCSV